MCGHVHLMFVGLCGFAVGDAPLLVPLCIRGFARLLCAGVHVCGPALGCGRRWAHRVCPHTWSVPADVSGLGVHRGCARREPNSAPPPRCPLRPTTWLQTFLPIPRQQPVLPTAARPGAQAALPLSLLRSQDRKGLRWDWWSGESAAPGDWPGRGWEERCGFPCRPRLGGGGERWVLGSGPGLGRGRDRALALPSPRFLERV